MKQLSHSISADKNVAPFQLGRRKTLLKDDGGSKYFAADYSKSYQIHPLFPLLLGRNAKRN